MICILYILCESHRPEIRIWQTDAAIHHFTHFTHFFLPVVGRWWGEEEGEAACFADRWTNHLTVPHVRSTGTRLDHSGPSGSSRLRLEAVSLFENMVSHRSAGQKRDVDHCSARRKAWYLVAVRVKSMISHRSAGQEHDKGHCSARLKAWYLAVVRVKSVISCRSAVQQQDISSQFGSRASYLFAVRGLAYTGNQASVLITPRFLSLLVAGPSFPVPSVR